MAVALALSIAACGDDEETAERAPVEELEASFVPSELLGLSVQPESAPEGLVDVRNSYLEAVRLFSLRSDDDQLLATLQVGRFGDDVEFRDPEFRRGLLSQLGSTRPQPVRVGEETVFLTAGVKQRLAVWFQDDHMFILGTRDEFDRPRTLLREALEVTP